MIVATSFRLMAQDEKTEKAEANFCESVNGFLSSLKDLESANLRMDIPNFTDAYKKVDKAWNKLVKSAKKLEKIDSKEATKAYNELAETLEEVVNYNIKTSVNTEKITKQIAKSRDTINQLNTAICE
jgi:exonuclease VII small subunit